MLRHPKGVCGASLLDTGGGGDQAREAGFEALLRFLVI
jgi:hypothetical protein